MNQTELNIRQKLFELQDLKYKDFQCGLMPTVDSNTVIGVRSPHIRALAKMLKNTDAEGNFTESLPHTYYEEFNLHGYLINLEKNFLRCAEMVDVLLPWVDNWATCDLISPKVFRDHREELMPYIEKWIASEHTYTIRFGMKMLMDFYLEDGFEAKYPEMVSSVKSDEYYVNMMIAWYFATALAKQWDAVIPYFTEPVLERWTHNKAIQKAIESFRITPEQKTYLKSLKIK